MRILITGRENSGSWQIRAVQLGEAACATVIPNATVEQIKAHDVVVLVKRPTVDMIRNIQAAKRPFVWDIVDAWPQPAGNAWNRQQAIDWLSSMVSELRPAAVITATQSMQRDLNGTIKAQTIAHHAREGQLINPIRQEVQTVGYEGRECYLDHWNGFLNRECQRRGWRFVVNPPNLADCDIGIALRAGQWDGYAPREWKSNVKLANFQATGTPCIVGPESGYLETQSGAEYFVSGANDLRMSLDWLTPWENRIEISQRLQTVTPRIEKIAAKYRDFLASV